MRCALLLLPLMVVGCASSGSTAEQAERPAAIFTSSETGTLLGATQHAAIATYPAPAAAVWAAVKKMYADWGVPLKVENPTTHQIGNNEFTRSRQFAGRPMTELVDCGSGPEGAKAGNYRIYMSLLAFVTADPAGGTKVQINFLPVGQDVSGTSTDRMPCGTTGRLEQLMLETVKANLGKS